MELTKLVSWLDDYLQIDAYDDISLNGLQVEGTAAVHKVAVAVDACMGAFEQAAQIGADMLIVHHGLFWGSPLAIRGMHGARVRYLLENNISLYAAHIPLDAHQEVGNNWGLAKLLGLADLDDFGSWKGKPVGVKGIFPNPCTLREIADMLEKMLGESVLVHAGGELNVSSMGIISGAAARDLVLASEQGLDLFLTGEPKHDVFYDAFERKMNAMYAGHYMTETIGVKLLSEKIEAEFGLDCQFILLPTGL
ncbi:MAG: Nif3-like dinuclear metal center hexameric protein [Deinococcota bacterium]